MTDRFSFSIKYKNYPNIPDQKLVFDHGLNIIYGENNVGKSELIKLLSVVNSKNESIKFALSDQSIITDIQIIEQNPDAQIVGNSLKNELAFNIENKFNDPDAIKDELELVQNSLLFNADLCRHPSKLSGGEKELLNISTAMSLNPKVLLIDDGLSFLSERMKQKVVSKLYNSDIIILWFTSDINDLQYTDQKWEMTPEFIKKTNIIAESAKKKEPIIEGQLNLEISNLSFSYEVNKNIFKNVKFDIDNFRCLGIAGENGSGKSTLASLLLNIEKPASGKIELNYDQELLIGFLDQFPERLIGISTIKEFMNKLISGKIFDPDRVAEIASDLNELNIDWEAVKNKSGITLSWTILRIVLICILANSNYNVLILDEPTFGMGFNQKNKLRSYLIRYLAKKHLILISHDKLLLESMCDRIIEL